MAGNYHNKLENYTKNWVLANFGNVTDTHIPSIHIDDLLEIDKLDPQEAVDLSLVVFQNMVTEIKKLNVTIQPCLVIFLDIYSCQLRCIVPRSKIEVVEQLYITPPNFYLRSWKRPEHYFILEEYRKHLPFDLVKAKDIFAYYSEYREYDMDGVIEFNRTINLEFYPKGLYPSPW